MDNLGSGDQYYCPMSLSVEEMVKTNKMELKDFELQHENIQKEIIKEFNAQNLIQR